MSRIPAIAFLPHDIDDPEDFLCEFTPHFDEDEYFVPIVDWEEAQREFKDSDFAIFDWFLADEYGGYRDDSDSKFSTKDGMIGFYSTRNRMQAFDGFELHEGDDLAPWMFITADREVHWFFTFARDRLELLDSNKWASSEEYADFLRELDAYREVHPDLKVVQFIARR